MANYLVFITSKVHGHVYLYFVPNSESSLQAQLDAWKEFQQGWKVKEDDWLLRSFELSMDGGVQYVEKVQ